MLTVKSATGEYKAVFHTDFEEIKKLVKECKPYVIVDNNLIRLYPDLFNGDEIIGFNALEVNKAPEMALRYCDQLLGMGINRNSKLLTVGGGITQDITGFIGNILFRGIHWEFIPTTLLAQTDSCVGGKTSMNFNQYKNVLGTFYPPKKIHLCSKFLDTLTLKDYCSGLGETMKFMIIGRWLADKQEKTWEDFKFDLDNILNRVPGYIDPYIRTGLNIKVKLIQKDEFDNGIRQVLNYGHTLGHAIEAITNYDVPHGLAIIYGMVMANQVSLAMGLANTEITYDILQIAITILKKAGLNIDDMYNWPVDSLIEKTKKDKKNTVQGDYTGMILPDRNLAFKKVNVPHGVIRSALKK